MATGNGTPRYVVLYPPLLQDQFQRWADRAVALGLAAEYGTFLLRMADQLVHDPTGWADTIWKATGRPGVFVCWRYSRLVCVEFHVSRTDRRVRVVRAITPIGSPLA